MQREEKTVQKAIKEAAKRDDMGSAKVSTLYSACSFVVVPNHGDMFVRCITCS